MQNAAAITALAAILGGSYLLLRSMQQQGSGAGTVTTDNTSEGTLMDLNGLANQIAAAATSAPQDNPTHISQAGLDALKSREGFSAAPYADHKGFSIGYGHLIKPGETLQYVSLQQATDLLLNDILWAEEAVINGVTAPLSQGQFDALVSFAYNVGAGAFQRSTLVRRINLGDTSASQEFDRWIYASGQPNNALIARRTSERNQYENATA